MRCSETNQTETFTNKNSKERFINKLALRITLAVGCLHRIPERKWFNYLDNCRGRRRPICKSELCEDIPLNLEIARHPETIGAAGAQSGQCSPAILSADWLFLEPIAVATIFFLCIVVCERSCGSLLCLPCPKPVLCHLDLSPRLAFLSESQHLAATSLHTT